MLVPPELGQTSGLPLPRELVFVIDTSGSMSGSSIEQAKAAVRFGLRGLQRGDAFNVVEFNSVTRALAQTPIPATPENLALADAFVSALRADGGTEMAAALNAVQQVNERMRDLLAKLEYPVLADIGLVWTESSAAAGVGELDYSPRLLRDLYAQEPMMVSFRVPGELPGRELAVTGRVSGQDWFTRVPIQGAGQARGLDVLWARHRIQALTQGLSRGANPEDVRSEVTRLGLCYHIVTDHTSLVALDRTPARPVGAPSRDGQVPVKQPQGWDLALPDPRAATAWTGGTLPQTATPARLKLLIGATLLGLALVLSQVPGNRVPRVWRT